MALSRSRGKILVFVLIQLPRMVQATATQETGSRNAAPSASGIVFHTDDYASTTTATTAATPGGSSGGDASGDGAAQPPRAATASSTGGASWFPLEKDSPRLDEDTACSPNSTSTLVS